MRRRVSMFARRLAAVALGVTLLATATPPAPAQAALDAGQLQLVRVTGGFTRPLGVTHAGDGSGRLFVIERGGKVRVVKGGKIQAAAFLDITGKVSSAGIEDGLLGFAFHPEFETNRRVFAFYTNTSSNIVISRFTATEDRSSVPTGSEETLLTISHPSGTIHHGGSLAFGADGLLYISVGDGGLSTGWEKARLLDNHLGKILRIDVDGTGGGPSGRYGIPEDNPYADVTGLDEIWAYGFRNPFKLTVDRSTGVRWIGDVGESTREEIDREPADAEGGRDYGWAITEGTGCFDPPTGCDTSGITMPVAEYGRDVGRSVTGGYVYRGSSQRDLQGSYVFGDFVSGRVWTMPHDGTAITQRLDTTFSIAGFGESESGELYALDYAAGALYRVVAPEFTDIATSSFLDDIHWLAYEGITSGCGGTKYCPTDPVSRGQMASFLSRALDLPPTTTDYFTDDEDSTHQANINRVAQAQITKGCTTTTFCPLADVTRGQMASFLVRALDLPPTSNDYFTDDDGTTHEADINRMRAAGITSGCSATSFCPKESVTRGQMAAFLRRALGD